MTSAPKKDSVVLIDEQKIMTIEPMERLELLDDPTNSQLQDYGKAIIVPGLINLHTHLDYSLLPSFKTGESLLPWTRELMKTVKSWGTSDWLNSARHGAKMAAQYGTSFLVDSSYSGSAIEAIAESGLRGLIGLELFGIDENKAEITWSGWTEKFKNLVDSGSNPVQRALSNERLSITVAPHAPYTVCPALWKYASDWAITNGQLLLTHLAESEQERLWFLNNDPEMLEHLRFAFGSFGNGAPWKDSQLAWKPSGYSSVEHLERHQLLNASLLAAHVLAVSDNDLDKLGRHNVSIVHCPRSNARLRNGYAALEKMRLKNLKFGLGTDSLASCEDLDLLAEARFAVALNRALHPTSTYGARQALESLTIEAARCLNKSDQIGSLEAGKKADLAIFQINQPSLDRSAFLQADPYELLLWGNCQLQELFVDGVSVYKNEHILDRSLNLVMS